MKAVDRLIRNWRFARALPHLRQAERLLDVGCADWTLSAHLGDTVAYVGIDPRLKFSITGRQLTLVQGVFPDDMPNEAPFDVIALLAVLEHVPEASHGKLAGGCWRHLKPGGRVVLTSPAPFADRLLAIFQRVRLIDGMELDQHYGFDPQGAPPVFCRAGFQMKLHRRFEFGMNHLFIFEKPALAMPMREAASTMVVD